MSEFVEVKTAELTGAALDWAVAMAEDWNTLLMPMGRTEYSVGATAVDVDGNVTGFACRYSTDWSQGGPLIEKHRVGFGIYADHYFAVTGLNDSSGSCNGPTHLIAACRAIVASVLGKTVSVPRELLP